jgi:hypothetical protein
MVNFFAPGLRPSVESAPLRSIQTVGNFLLVHECSTVLQYIKLRLVHSCTHRTTFLAAVRARLVPQLAEENQEGRLRARACVLTRLLGLVSDERAPTLTLNTALEKIRSARAADRLGHVCRLRRQVRSRSQFAAVHYSFYLKTTAYACHGTG